MLSTSRPRQLKFLFQVLLLDKAGGWGDGSDVRMVTVGELMHANFGYSYRHGPIYMNQAPSQNKILLNLKPNEMLLNFQDSLVIWN